MKKLMFISSVLMLCMACQKMEIQSSPEGTLTASSDAVEGYLVGIGFYGGAHPYGDATITFGSTTSSSTLIVPFNATNKNVTITAVGYGDYVIDYWWQYSSQPPYNTSITPVPTKVHTEESSFTHNVTGEVWFEPVFKLEEPEIETETVELEVTYMVVDDIFNSQSYIEYKDPSGTWQTVPLSVITHTYELEKGTSLRVVIQLRALHSDGGRGYYCMYKDPDGVIKDRSNSDDFGVDIYDYTINSNSTIVIRAEFDDFRDQFYNDYGGGN